ncbi:LON peptidase N-terminal domain and RING finger protein 1-like [Anthonomus grandis grandis]|uniref:LON peptidase N-terminal domain and RING finger protein 1-like n=1 Tax=Anthonomus grandis grandis TaxID=2921223 RepID=UPI002165A3B3|nr:LON peptidase N-terminal domain and RING finger protein 1-like [Anthonomus grandis grandis]
MDTRRKMKQQQHQHFRTHPYNKKPQKVRQVVKSIQEQKLTLFSCTECGNILCRPVTVKCGHTFCTGCLDRMEKKKKCQKCFEDIEHQDGARVNVLVQTLIDKWKEKNWIGHSEKDIPALILQLYPRYTLRSGYAGLECSINTSAVQKRSKIQRTEINFPRKQMYERIQHRKKTTRNLEKYAKRNQKEGVTFEKMLDRMLANLESTVEKALRESWNTITIEDLECLLCRRCLFDPVTTPCGHTFCRDCLTRVLDHRLTCPLCVSPLSVGDYFRGTTRILDQAVKLLFPGESVCHMYSFNGKTVDVPVFVCTNAFPGVACHLYVYEPRYRLLIRRCLQTSDKTFAMASLDHCTGKFMPYGTILEVRDAVTLEDGRIILSAQGIRRFKVLSRSEKDGYDTAVIEHIRDVTPSVDSVNNLVSLHTRVYNRAAKWIRLLSRSALSEVERLIGKMPTVEKDWINLPDGPSWTWWLIPILPLSSQLQVGFLRSATLEKRLRAIDKMLEHMKVRMKAVSKEDDSVSYSHQSERVEFCGD